MDRSINDRLLELESLLDSALYAVSQMEELEGADPFDLLAANSRLHDYLKRGKVEADALTKNFSAQMKRKAGRK